MYPTVQAAAVRKSPDRGSNMAVPLVATALNSAAANARSPKSKEKAWIVACPTAIFSLCFQPRAAIAFTPALASRKSRHFGASRCSPHHRTRLASQLPVLLNLAFAHTLTPRLPITRTSHLHAHAPCQLHKSINDIARFATQWPLHLYAKQSTLLCLSSNAAASSYLNSARIGSSTTRVSRCSNSRSALCTPDRSTST